MSVFAASDDRILIEEIVEVTEEQEAELCSSSETVDESSVATSVAVAEIAETQEQQTPQQRQNGSATGCRTAGQNAQGITAISINGDGTIDHGSSTGGVGRVTPRSHMEQEKRMRREIANSNERRRMQSINAGFQSLRTLLPHHEGEKLSKVTELPFVHVRPICSLTSQR
ncbi:helix-loop-helix protein 11-like [Cephus cinctus]|uniref:Helix-loop-helix protein 11-like n=1 Tax=Cephus cinctus TaxID=211228 RepID=A0AAJ7RNE0_CEPCN|nr:helix-loop-helix protein 11-like [Cephus cinctus]